MTGESESTGLKRDAKERLVRAEVERLLGDPSLENRALLRKLEELARCYAFNGLTWLWGPQLYGRNRVVFRPFIILHFSTWAMRGFLGKNLAWKGKVAEHCEPWLQECDDRVDMELFDRLWSWKHGAESGFAERRVKLFRRRLISRFKEAGTPAARVATLRNFRVWFALDEDTACELYGIDPRAAGPFLRYRIPTSYWSGDKRTLWSKLLHQAEEGGDELLVLEIYRRTVPFKTWRTDLELYCHEISDAEELNRTLIARHPRGYLRQAGDAFVSILKLRGPDVFPYVLTHLRSVNRGILFSGSYKALVGLAERRRWWNLWATVVRVVGHANDFDVAVHQALALPEQEARSRLAMLAGVSREFNWGGFSAVHVPVLKDKTAVEFHEKYPDLLRGPFRPNLGGLRSSKELAILKALIAREDEDLIDYCASRLATSTMFWGGRGLANIGLLVDYYTGLKVDSVHFARRACAVLTQIPAYTIFDYRSLIKNNALARLLFERSPQEFLAVGDGLQDLVEAQEIHVMGLAYRLLAMDDPRARQIASENLTILIGTLLRPLMRRTRLRAFGALENAASSEANAARILAKAREALDLPDKFYPKEELIGLIGRLLHRWPSLRGNAEHPDVFHAA